METVKNNWPYIAVSAAAIALGAYLYLNNEFEKEKVRADRKERKLLKKETERAAKAAALKEAAEKKAEVARLAAVWPELRDLLNMEDDHAKQLKELENWLQTRLTTHMEHKKSFKVGEDHNLSEEDFVKIYDLIECYVNVQLMKQTKEADVTRQGIFKQAFTDGNNLMVAAYATAVNSKIEVDQEVYQEAVDKMTGYVKVNNEIFNSTISAFMDPTSQLIKTCFQLTTPSAYKYTGDMTKEQLVGAYDKAAAWARETIKKNKSLVEYITSQQFDSADRYLLLTYLILDKLHADHGINSLVFRAAASHHKLNQTENFKKIADALYQEALDEEKEEESGMASL